MTQEGYWYFEKAQNKIQGMLFSGIISVNIRKGSGFMDIDSFWRKLKEYEGEIFHTVTGLEFTYSFESENAIKVSRAEQLLTKNNFNKAIEHLPLDGPGEISKIVRGSAYVFSLLTDSRMQES